MSSLFIHHRREKLLNAIAYFARNTSHCHTLKVYKLLYFLDFEHYRQTGRSVTGLSYHAFPQGPVSVELHNEIKDEGETSTLAIRETHDDMTGVLIKREFAQRNFDSTWLTPRELEIMKRLVLFFGDAKAEVMSASSHDSKLPWKKIYGNGEGRGHAIPYELALQAEPIVKDEPTIDEEERLMLEELFQETGLR